jgi:hypothetical protein
VFDCVCVEVYWFFQFSGTSTMYHMSSSVESTIGSLKHQLSLVVGLQKNCLRLFVHGIPLVRDLSPLGEYGIVASRMNEIRVVESPMVDSVMLLLDWNGNVTPVFVAPSAPIAQVITDYERTCVGIRVSSLTRRGLDIDISHGTVSSQNLLSLDVLQVTASGRLAVRASAPHNRRDYPQRKLFDCFPRDLADRVIDVPGDRRCGYWALLCGMLKIISDSDADDLPLAHLLAFKSALASRISAISLDLTDEGENMEGNLVRSGIPWSDLLQSVVLWYLESGSALATMCIIDPVWTGLYEQVRLGMNNAAVAHGSDDPLKWINKPAMKALVRVGMQGIVHALLAVDCGSAVDGNISEHAQFGQGLHLLVALCGCFQAVAVVQCTHYFDVMNRSIGYNFIEPAEYRCSSVRTGLPSCVLFQVQRHCAGYLGLRA